MARETVNGILAIVADDLTGASDSAVQFAEAGWPVFLLLEPTGPHAPRESMTDLFGSIREGVVALTSDARALPHDAAADASSSVVARAIAGGASRLFIKVDSTMRGSVAAQIDGAMGVWRSRHPQSFAVVCPAYPRMGRTVEGGVVRAHGALLENSAAGRDPVTPLRTSEIARLLPGSVHVALTSNPDAAARVASFAVALTAAAARAEGSRGVPVLTVDAVTDEHLELIARAIVVLNGRAVPVGSAGLAHAMADAWGVDEAHGAPPAAEPISDSEVPLRVAVVVSSLHGAARAQADHLARSAAGATLTRWCPAQRDLADSSRAEAWARAAALEPVRDIALLVGPVPVPPGDTRGDETDGDADPTEVSEGAAIVADSLASVACLLIERQRSSVLVLVGGDGARAVLTRAGAAALRVLDQLAEGVSRGLVVGGMFDGIQVVTKAGGFGAEDALTDIVGRLRSADRVA